MGYDTGVIPTMTEGEPFSHQLLATGGTGDTTWSVLSGTLPAGITLSSTGELSGTPGAPPNGGSVRVEATDGVTSATKLLFLVTVAASAQTTAVSPVAPLPESGHPHHPHGNPSLGQPSRHTIMDRAVQFQRHPDSTRSCLCHHARRAQHVRRPCRHHDGRARCCTRGGCRHHRRKHRRRDPESRTIPDVPTPRRIFLAERRLPGDRRFGDRSDMGLRHRQRGRHSDTTGHDRRPERPRRIAVEAGLDRTHDAFDGWTTRHLGVLSDESGSGPHGHHRRPDVQSGCGLVSHQPVRSQLRGPRDLPQRSGHGICSRWVRRSSRRARAAASG